MSSAPDLPQMLPVHRKESILKDIVADIRSERSSVDDGSSKMDPAEHAGISDFIESCRETRKESCHTSHSIGGHTEWSILTKVIRKDSDTCAADAGMG